MPSLSDAPHEIGTSVFAALAAPLAARREAGLDLVPLHIGDTYLDAPAPVDAPTVGELSTYGAIAGMPELRAALAEHRRAAGLTLAAGPDHVHVANGCTHGVYCAARAVLRPGDEVLVMSPYWPLATGVLKTAGARPVEVPLTLRLFEEPDLDVAALLEAHCTSRTRAIYFISPNNPDGMVFDARVIDAIAEVARRRDLWVLADEVYADFVYEGEHHYIANRPGMAERTLSLYSLSKSHGLAGARIGYVVGTPAVIAAVRTIANYTVFNVAVPMQRAAIAAVEAGAAWQAEARDRYLEARDATVAALVEVGLEAPVPRGGSFFFVDLSDALGGEPLMPMLRRAIDHGVLIAPGRACGRGYDRHARLCFTAAPAARVVEGVRRLGEALGGRR